MDFSDVFPLFTKTEEDIRAEVDARANVGLTTDDPEWVDTRVGSAFYIATQPSVVALAEVYSRLNEVAAASIPATSWESWLDLHAFSYGLLRKPAVAASGFVTFVGEPGTIVGTGVEVSPVQTDPGVEPPVFVTTQSGTIPGGGILELEVVADEPGVSGNVSAGTVTLLQTGVGGIASVTNDESMDGGSEVESDEALKTRLTQLFQGRGSGNQADYTRWALAEPGVGRVTVIPLWNGLGTVQVIIMDDDGRPVGPAVVTSLQTRLDPVPGQGAGQAPIDHEVTVDTPVEITIDVAATLTFKSGYSLDGSSGTVALREELQEAVLDYLNGLAAGEDVIYNAVRAAFFDVEGVLDVTALTVEGGTTDVAIETTPPQVAVATAGGVVLT
jgi:uncharacterized phage protein gp47/JayE